MERSYYVSRTWKSVSVIVEALLISRYLRPDYSSLRLYNLRVSPTKSFAALRPAQPILVWAQGAEKLFEAHALKWSLNRDLQLSYIAEKETEFIIN